MVLVVLVENMQAPDDSSQHYDCRNGLPNCDRPKVVVDPWNMEGSAAILMKMFDDLASVATLIRKVQSENTRLRDELVECNETIAKLRGEDCE